MITRFRAVIHNLSRTGVPTLLGAVIAVVEAGLPAMRWADDNGYESEFHDQLGLMWRPGRFRFVRSHAHHLHGAGATYGRRNLTPARWLLVVVLEDLIEGRGVAFLVTHWVDSAFEPGAKNKALRLRLWLRARRRTREVIAGLEGLPVVLLGDFNRGGFADIGMGLDNAAGTRLDRILVTPGVFTAIGAKEGPHTGDAGHTHPSLRTTLEWIR